MKNNRHIFWIFAFAVVLYRRSITFDFIEMDDLYYVLENHDVVSPNIFRIFDPRTLTVGDWTPVVTLSHAIEYQLWGFQSWGYHLSNILLHLATCLVLTRVFVPLQFRIDAAVLAVMIFSVPPLQVESVAWNS